MPSTSPIPAPAFGPAGPAPAAPEAVCVGGGAFLAQTGTLDMSRQILGWSVGLLVAVVVLVVTGQLLRRWFRRETHDLEGVDFGLADLRRMRDAGQLSEAEYERARARILARAQAGSSDPAVDAFDPHEAMRSRDDAP